MRALVLACVLAFAGASALAADAEAPAWSPETADLLFASSRDGNSEIYVLRAGDAEWTNLTQNPSGDNWPVWSPDGARIAFQSKRAGNLDIWAMNADGSEQVQLTTDPEPDYLPSWSPDGRTILFTSWRTEAADAERAPHIYAMNADGSGQRRLVRESLNTSSGAAWSPDGSTIVYSRGFGKGADIFVAASGGTNERRITHDAERSVYNGSPAISPDGASIAFYSDDETSAALVVARIDGTGRRTVLADGHNWYPRWSPDGRWLVYTATVAGGSEGDIDIFAVRASGEGKPVVLAKSPMREQEGSWRGDEGGSAVGRAGGDGRGSEDGRGGGTAVDAGAGDAAADTLARYLRGLEQSLHQPDVRKSNRLAELIADDFVEYASAGCIYTKADLVAALQAETPVVQTSSDYSVAMLGPHAALVTYRIHRHSEPPVHTLRSSVWRMIDGRWQMVFHQATLTTAPR